MTLHSASYKLKIHRSYLSLYLVNHQPFWLMPRNLIPLALDASASFLAQMHQKRALCREDELVLAT